ncbi:MAG: hypothetical protein ACLRMZ_28225 [Blautia marasmi]
MNSKQIWSYTSFYEKEKPMEQSLSIERILKELYHISGFRICIYDTDFHEIAAYPHELGCFCGLIQKHPEESVSVWNTTPWPLDV